jgi:hypothetical protein
MRDSRLGAVGKAEAHVTIDAVVAVRETARAILCRWDDDRVDHWIAKSQLDAESEVKHSGDHGALIVSAWFARTVKLVVGAR